MQDSAKLKAIRQVIESLPTMDSDEQMIGVIADIEDILNDRPLPPRCSQCGSRAEVYDAADADDEVADESVPMCCACRGE